MSDSGPLLIEKRGRTVWLTLNRPEAANALSLALVTALADALAALREDREIAALVVAGAGDKAFCSGADLKERRSMSLDDARSFLDLLRTTFDALAAFPCPVIAAVGGVAYGGGLELALACDIIIAADRALMALPEVRLGIIPGAGGTQRLPRLIGVTAAKDLILTGRRIDAAQARELGLVAAVVPAADLAAEVEHWAREIGEGGSLAVAQAKRAIDEGWGRPLAAALGVERKCYEVVLASEDRNEGLQAFAEKRKPKFQGK